ncbi:MAG: carbohydrate kinase [Clostridiales bacterium]|nr:carbohydrate kinase [Clostridiales bacterium]
MFLIGIDVGTTGTKCTIFNESGNILSYSYQGYNIIMPKKGHYELDPNIVKLSVLKIIKDSVKKAGSTDNAYIAISSMGEAFVQIDKNGEVLNNSMLYIDNRGQNEIDELCAKICNKDIMKKTGLSPHKMYSLPKIMWIKNNNLNSFKKTWKFLLYEDYISYILTGETYIDYSLASRTMAFNVVSKKWDSGILNHANIDVSLLSTPVQAGTVIGKIRKDIQSELGLPSNTYILTGGHDQACAALGGGALTSGMSVDGMGTADCITTVFDKPITNELMEQYNYNCEPHLIANKYISLAYCSSSGSIIKWFRDNFSYEEKQIALKSDKNEYQLLDSYVSNEPTGLILLPHFSGSGTPYLDNQALGGIFGLTLQTSKYDIYQSILEGITYEMKYNLECLQEAGINTKVIKALGGGAQSDVWLQMKADIFKIPVERPIINEASSLGAAMLCFKAAKIHGTLEEVSKKLVKTGKIFYPRNEYHKKYMKIYEKYKKAYKAMRNVMNSKEIT